MGDLNLQVRYISNHMQAPVEEKTMVFKTTPRQIPAAESALVLVDVWNDLYDKEFMERARKIITEKIVPLSRAFRDAGSLIVHAPSASVALKYPQFLSQLTDQEIWGNPQPKHAWPPKEFTQKTGPYCHLNRVEDKSPNQYFQDIIKNWEIAKEMEPQRGDIVIRTGEELHHLLEKRKILYLFYAGFATNVCMLNRDYGMKAMSKRGFEIILARDATTGIEYAHTHDTLGQTAAAITTQESNIGYSILTAELLEAFKNIKD